MEEREDGALRVHFDDGAATHVDVDPVTHLWAPGLDVFKKMHQEPGE